MRTLVSIALVVLCIFSCEKHHKKLFIKTTSVAGTNENEVKTDSLSEITSDYFEVSFDSYRDNVNRWFEAKQELQLNNVNEFTYVFFKVVDYKGNPVRFANRIEFLNFMSARGYEMVKEDNSHYTFKRVGS